MSSAVGKLLGGEAVLGGAARSNVALARATRSGLPAGAVVMLARVLRDALKPDGGQLHRIVVQHSSPRMGELLTPAESDIVVRAASAMARATDVLGDQPKAAHWLATPNQALGGETPVSFLDTTVGFREVENLLDRIEHGIYS